MWRVTTSFWKRLLFVRWYIVVYKICKFIVFTISILLWYLCETSNPNLNLNSNHSLSVALFTGRKMEFPSPGNVPKMWNFLNVSGSRKCQCFRNISWYILGQNFLYISWLPKTWPIRNLSCNHLNSKFPRHFLDLKLHIRYAWHFNIHYNIIMQACKTWTVHRCSDELIKRLVHNEENIMTTKRNASMME